MVFTKPSEVPALVTAARANYKTNVSLPLDFRLGQLNALIRLLDENVDAMQEAMHKDLGSGLLMARCVEYNSTRIDIQHIIGGLRSWAKPEKKSSPLLTLPASSVVQRQAYGVVLLISPWNYPVSLVLEPLAAALAAGNVCVVKPSEISKHTSHLMSELLRQYMDPRAVTVVEGEVDVATALLEERWDFICYTGSTQVGKIVHQAAAKHLTPCLLELGGKSPTIVSSKANMKRTCERLCWGKFFMNVGQTCIAPDYVLVHKDVEAEFLTSMAATLKKFFGDAHHESEDLSRIITAKHASRLADLLQDRDIEIVCGGKQFDLFMEPTIVRATPDSKCMQEEIFGPILPVLAVDSIEEAVEFIDAREKPLAAYVFSEDRKETDYVMQHTTSGALGVNEVLMQMHPNLPFGGVGNSGMGAYHGKYGFETFSHPRAVLTKYGDDVPLRFPPYSDNKVKVLMFLQRFEEKAGAYLKAILVIMVAVAAYMYFQP